MPEPPEPSVYQLRAVLLGISPIIWRRLLGRGDLTIADLQVTLQIAFGWSDDHLHRFLIHGKQFASFASLRLSENRRLNVDDRLEMGILFRSLFLAKNRLEIIVIMEELVQQTNPEPRWPAFIAVLAGGGLYTALPAALTFGPRWLFPSVILALLIPTVISHHAGRSRLSAVFGFAVSCALTLGLIISLFLLIGALPAHKTPPETLLVSAASLWATNILVFALWYWRLDAGGPHQRDKRARHSNGAFLFPQMMMSEKALREARQQGWSPNFFDYLFLAFNTNTAFSPTDTPALTRWAKGLMMLQSLLSLLIIALLAARAVNIL